MSYDEQRMQSCYEQPEPLPPMFRAKDKDGLWVYGSYHYSADGKEHYIIEQQKFIRGFDQRGEDDPDRVCMFSAEVHDIEPSTVESLIDVSRIFPNRSKGFYCSNNSLSCGKVKCSEQCDDCRNPNL